MLFRSQKAEECEDKCQTLFIQKCMMYLFSARMICNMNDRNKKVLNEEELAQFSDITKKICAYLPQKVLFLKVKIGRYGIPRTLKRYLLHLKEESIGKKYELKQIKDSLYIEEDKSSEEQFNTLCEIGRLRAEKIEILAVNYTRGRLEIDAKSTAAELIDAEQMKIEAVCDGEVLSCNRLACYPLLKLFGKTYDKKHLFHVSVPVNRDKRSSKISFFVCVDGKQYLQKLAFSGQCSRLVRAFKKSYWQFDKNFLLVHNGTNRLYIKQVSDIRIWGREQKLRLEMYRKSREQKNDKEIGRASCRERV